MTRHYKNFLAMLISLAHLRRQFIQTGQDSPDRTSHPRPPSLIPPISRRKGKENFENMKKKKEGRRRQGEGPDDHFTFTDLVPAVLLCHFPILQVAVPHTPMLFGALQWLWFSFPFRPPCSVLPPPTLPPFTQSHKFPYTCFCVRLAALLLLLPHCSGWSVPACLPVPVPACLCLIPACPHLPAFLPRFPGSCLPACYLPLLTRHFPTCHFYTGDFTCFFFCLITMGLPMPLTCQHAPRCSYYCVSLDNYRLLATGLCAHRFLPVVQFVTHLPRFLHEPACPTPPRACWLYLPVTTFAWFNTYTAAAAFTRTPFGFWFLGWA